MRNARDDLVIDALAENNALLQEANRQLIDLVVDLALENSMLRDMWERELLARIYGEGRIALLERCLHPDTP